MAPRKDSHQEPDATFDRSWAELLSKQKANTDEWGFGHTERWDADYEKGTLTFSNANGFRAIADLQVVGTYSLEDETWLWSWANRSIAAPLTRAARQARQFGEKYGLEDFTTDLFECSEGHGWQFTSIALHLSEGAGAYRGPSTNSYVFMTFGKVTIFGPH